MNDVTHCLAKIAAILDRGQDDRRTLLQLGYNLGRLSELTNLGRESCWDAWKDAVTDWDLPAMRLQIEALTTRIIEQGKNS